ncbi:MAG: ABC transporter permease, partial [Bacteroidetes bacterium]|nr:ABC transporter permease [Bacteroidota bacterium]
MTSTMTMLIENFRVLSEMTVNNQTDKLGLSSFSLTPMLKAEYPEVEMAVRVTRTGKQTFWHEDKVLQYENIYFADADFFQFFKYNFLAGSPTTALLEKNSVVISDEIARGFFGSPEEALGKMIQFSKSLNKVTGVFKKEFNNSHLDVNAVISISTLPESYTEKLSWDWFWMAQSNYIQLHPNTNKEEFKLKLDQFAERHIDPWVLEEDVQGRLRYHLQELKDIH